MLGCCGVMFDWWYMMLIILSMVASFFLGVLLMFKLSRTEIDIYREESVRQQKELKAFEDVCDE